MSSDRRRQEVRNRRKRTKTGSDCKVTMKVTMRHILRTIVPFYLVTSQGFHPHAFIGPHKTRCVSFKSFTSSSFALSAESSQRSSSSSSSSSSDLLSYVSSVTSSPSSSESAKILSKIILLEESYDSTTFDPKLLDGPWLLNFVINPDKNTQGDVSAAGLTFPTEGK